MTSDVSTGAPYASLKVWVKSALGFEDREAAKSSGMSAPSGTYAGK